MTIFLDNIDLKNSVRIWDYMLVRGFVQAIPEITIAILFELQD
jgi:hypothetical protein